MKTGKDKIKCLECGKYFARPCSHVWQVHGLTAREYKELHGLDVKKGITTEEYKERMREHVNKHYDKVVAKNLIKGGKKSRFKKGDSSIGVYERSEQTLERLRKLERKGKPKSKRVTVSCRICSKEVERTENYIEAMKARGHKNTYCSRTCSTIGKNRDKGVSTL